MSKKAELKYGRNGHCHLALVIMYDAIEAPPPARHICEHTHDSTPSQPILKVYYYQI